MLRWEVVIVAVATTVAIETRREYEGKGERQYYVISDKSAVLMAFSRRKDGHSSTQRNTSTNSLCLSLSLSRRLPIMYMTNNKVYYILYMYLYTQ